MKFSAKLFLPAFVVSTCIACSAIYPSQIVQAQQTSLNTAINKAVNKTNNNEYALIEQGMTWSQAKAYCESIGGHLVTITTKEEQAFVASLVKNGQFTYYWIGANDNDIEGRFKWVSGEPFDYKSWTAGEPNNYLGVHSENFISMDKASGEWNDRPDDGVSGFVCEWDTQTTNPNLDFNSDEVVDIFDVAKVAQNYNTNNSLYDVNLDMRVDIYDLVYISKNTGLSYAVNSGISIGNSTSNLMSGGSTAYSNNYIYFRNDLDGGALYRSNSDGTEKMKVSSDAVKNINVLEQWIYYKNDSDAGKLYKVKIDGSSRMKVMDDIGEFYFVENGWVYFNNQQDNYSLYRINVKGQNKVKISADSISSFGVAQGLIFYKTRADQTRLYRINNDGTGKMVFIDGTIDKFDISEGWIFYSNTSDNNSIYKVQLSGASKQKVGAAGVRNLNVNDQWIYYYASDNKLSKIKKDGSGNSALGTELLVSENGVINTVKDFIYFTNRNDNGRIYKVKSDGTAVLIDSYKVIQNGMIIKEFATNSEAVSYGVSSGKDHINIKAPDGKITWTNYPAYKAVGVNGIVKEYAKGQLMEAIQYANAAAGGKVIGLSDDLENYDTLWNQYAYRVFEGEKLIMVKFTVAEAIDFARQGKSRKILGLNGEILWNADTNLLGYSTALETLNVRSVPSTTGNNPIGFLYCYEKVEIVATEGSWYKITYGNSFAYVSTTYIKTYTTPPANVVDIARSITSTYEGAGFVNVTGNFDGMGISVGYLQWNIGQGSLQSLLYRMDNQYNSIMKQVFGTNYDSIHNMLSMGTKDEQLVWAKGINDANNKIVEPWKTQFVNLCKTPEFQQIQKDAEAPVVLRAMAIVDKYSLDTVRGFALSFDIATQNGSVKASVAEKIDAEIAIRPNMTEKELLAVIAEQVALGSLSQWQNDVRSRKMTIVNGQGVVHGSYLYLDKNYGLNDNLWR